MLVSMIARRVSTFLASPEGGPILIGACLTAFTGAALGMPWVPWVVMLALAALIMTYTDGPQHPVRA